MFFFERFGANFGTNPAMSIWLPLVIGVLSLTWVMILFGLRWPKPISGGIKVQALLDRVLKMEGEGNLKQAAWLCHQAMEEDPENIQISDRLFDLYRRIGREAQSRGDFAEANLYLTLLPPEFSLYPDVENHQEELGQKEAFSLNTSEKQLPPADSVESPPTEALPESLGQECEGTRLQEKESDEPA